MEMVADQSTDNDIDVLFRALLGRPPESSATVEAFLKMGSRLAALQAIARSEEFKARTGLQFIDEHQVYRGYHQNDLAVFNQFPPYQGPGEDGFATNFLGGRFRTTFQAPLKPFSGVVEGYPVPVGGLQGETAEYIGALRSVLESSTHYTLLECGAGYGPWMGITAAAARARGISSFKLYGIEGDNEHVKFMRQHMDDCCIAKEQYEAILGAVGATNGEVSWALVEDPAAVYGGRPLEPGNLDYFGARQDHTVSIRMFSIVDLLLKEPHWDLVHVDIQGGEGVVCAAGIDEMTRRVRRVIIGTHSRPLDGEVFSIFHAAKWQLENEKPTQMIWQPNAASPESLTLVDGVQVWRNPRL